MKIEPNFKSLKHKNYHINIHIIMITYVIILINDNSEYFEFILTYFLNSLYIYRIL